MNDAYVDGYNARFAELRLSDNPYRCRRSVRWHDWRNGWTDADHLKKDEALTGELIDEDEYA